MEVVNDQYVSYLGLFESCTYEDENSLTLFIAEYFWKCPIAKSDSELIYFPVFGEAYRNPSDSSG